MAAGEGRRLRPVTERWPKPILPIDGVPVVATVLRELGAAGCDRVTVVTGHLAEQVERLVSICAVSSESRSAANLSAAHHRAANRRQEKQRSEHTQHHDHFGDAAHK